MVKDLMVPLSEYAAVSEEATLYDAVLALEEAQAAFDQSRYRHRAVLVYDKDKKVVGKVSQLDILRALSQNMTKQVFQVRSLVSVWAHDFRRPCWNNFAYGINR